MIHIILVGHSMSDVTIRITGDAIVTLRVVAAKREKIDENDEEFENIDEIEEKIIADYLKSLEKKPKKNRSKMSTNRVRNIFFDSDDSCTSKTDDDCVSIEDFLEETEDDIPW